jgi:transposase
MNEEKAAEKQLAAITLDTSEVLAADGQNRKNLGYAALSAIYHELELDVFLNNRARALKSKYSVNAIMRMLVYSRILAPASKKSTFEGKGMYFDATDFTLDDVYRCLTFAGKLTGDLQFHLHKKVTEKYGRDTELIYYDVTNYYFEIDEADRLRKKGVCKEHRPNPIVQMGLLMDNGGIPIAYSLFPGNTNDCETLLPILADVKKKYGLGRTIVVADKGMNTSSNIAYCVIKGDGYVYSQTVRGGNKEFKNFVLNDTGYQWLGEDYKKKSRIYPREIHVKDVRGKTKKVSIDEKQVAFYSRDYDKKAKADRAVTVQKARDLAKNPAKYNRATSYGAAKYVKNLSFDKKTGEIITAGQMPVFDEAKLAEEEKYDGYYAIVSSEIGKTDEEIIEIYRGLWKIEESFRVTKSDLAARPVYLSREDHIQAHFLICFIALVIARLLQEKLGGSFSVSAIAESLSKSCCTLLEENWYVLDHVDDVTAALRDCMGIDLTRKYLTHGEIKNILANAKKSLF